jgi:peptidoglycan/LPS O-acetylase OafA/YrhL
MPYKIYDVEIGYWLFGSLYQLCGGIAVFIFLQARRTTDGLLLLVFSALVILHGVAFKDSYSLATAISMALVLLAATASSRMQRIPVMVAILGFLGAASYGVYLLHQLCGALVGAIAAQSVDHRPAAGIAFVILALILTVILSHIAHKLIEAPSIKISKRLGQRQKLNTSHRSLESMPRSSAPSATPVT